jgi:excisionase family DNA binding protein
MEFADRRTPSWLTLDQMAAELQVPKATLYAWRAKGDFPRAVRYGKHLRVRRDDFDAWIQDKLRRSA